MESPSHRGRTACPCLGLYRTRWVDVDACLSKRPGPRVLAALALVRARACPPGLRGGTGFGGCANVREPGGTPGRVRRWSSSARRVAASVTELGRALLDGPWGHRLHPANARRPPPMEPTAKKPRSPWATRPSLKAQSGRHPAPVRFAPGTQRLFPGQQPATELLYNTVSPERRKPSVFRTERELTGPTAEQAVRLKASRPGLMVLGLKACLRGPVWPHAAVFPNCRFGKRGRGSSGRIFPGRFGTPDLLGADLPGPDCAARGTGPAAGTTAPAAYGVVQSATLDYK